MWARLQSLSDKDDWLGQAPDPRVAHDPDDPHFAMSFGGEGFFVVGLHPRASRPARRFAVPAMVFNLHDQFEQLRAQGRYQKIRSTIIGRDEALAGSANPMLAEHGTISAARQYSGRAVERRLALSVQRPQQRKDRRLVNEIPPRSGTAFTLESGQRLTVIDPKGDAGRRPAGVQPRRHWGSDQRRPNARLCRDDSADGRPHALFQPLKRDARDRRGHGRRSRFPADALLVRDLPPFLSRRAARIAAASAISPRRWRPSA